MHRRAEPSQAGWLGVLFGETFAHRMIVALAVSIALHEGFAGLVPGLPQPSDQKEIIENVQIARVETRPTPTPKPTPPPPAPPIVVHSRVIAQTQKPSVVPAPPGKSSRVEAIKHAGAARPKPPHTVHTKPIWEIVPPTAGQGAGANKGKDAGSLGTGGTGSGTGTSGTGGGAGGGGCGYVEFSNQPGPPRFDAATGFYVYTDIVMTVHRADGSIERTVLDYPWRYKNEAGDPFVHADAPMLFEFPPKSMRASEPPLVQYVMSKTTPMGSTDLQDCPGTAPTP